MPSPRLIGADGEILKVLGILSAGHRLSGRTDGIGTEVIHFHQSYSPHLEAPIRSIAILAFLIEGQFSVEDICPCGPHCSRVRSEGEYKVMQRHGKPPERATGELNAKNET